MPTVDYLPFATDALANVMSQADYLALTTRPLGYQSGIALSAQLNKTWRQSSVMTAALANYVSQQTGLDVLDDGNVAALTTKLINAIQIGTITRPTRIVTVSTALTIVAADYAVGLARIAAPAATAASLPSAAQVGQEFVVEDLVGNFFAFPVTVTPPAGDNIAGGATFVCNINKQSVSFRRYAVAGAWSVKS